MAERDFTPDMSSGIQAGSVRPALFFEGEFVDGAEAPAYVRIWTGLGTITWNGNDWLGAGKLMGLDGIEETADTRAVTFSISLSGIAQADVALALQYTRRGRPGKLWLALFDDSMQLVADPYLLKQGKFSMAPVDDSGDTATITATYEDVLAALQQPRERRYDSHSQAVRDADDLGFEYVEVLQDANFDFFIAPH